jgi:tubulin alpha
MASGKLVPRTIFVDVEPTSIDEIHTGAYKDVFNPEYFVSGREDGGCGSFTRAYNVWSTIKDDVMDRIGRLTEECDNCQGFLIIHALGGGAGSGVTAQLMEALSITYGKRAKLQFAIYPTAKLSTPSTGPYNTVLSTYYTNDHTNCCFLVDNDAIYDIAQRNLGIPSPSYEDLNCLIAHTIADVTACLRFEGELNVDLNEFQTNLVPYPALHFPVISHAPIVSRANATHSELTTPEITNALFDPTNQLVRSDLLTGKFMSCCLLYRGDVTPREVNVAIAQIKSRPDIPFVDWCPTGFKVGLVHHPKAFFPDDLTAPAKRS